MPRWGLDLEKHAPPTVLTSDLEDMLGIDIDDGVHTFEWRHQRGIVYQRIGGRAHDVWLLVPSSS